MASELIEMEGGILVEIDVPGDQCEQISGGAAKKVAASFQSIQPVLASLCRPLKSTWEELNRDVEMEKAEVEIGLSFEGEGNLFVTKAKAGANVTIKLTMAPKKT